MDRALYDDDFYAWTQEQAELLRQGSAASNRLDFDLIAEEIEDLGKSELHTVQSLCEHIIEHLLNWSIRVSRAGRHWRREIASGACSSEKADAQHLAKLDLSTGIGRQSASAVFGGRFPGLGTVPAECPYSLEQILGSGEEDWFPGRVPAALMSQASRSSAAVAVSMRLFQLRHHLAAAAGPAGSGREIPA